jgi:hypothetical protein
MADFLIKAAETAFKSTIQDKVIKSLEPVIKENIKNIEVLKTKIDTELGTLSSTVKNLIPDTLKDTVDVIKIKGFVDSIDSSVFKKVFDDVIEQQSDDDLKSLNLTKEHLKTSIGGLPDDIKEIFKKHIDSVFGNKKTAESSTTDTSAAPSNAAALPPPPSNLETKMPLAPPSEATTAATTDAAALPPPPSKAEEAATEAELEAATKAGLARLDVDEKNETIKKIMEMLEETGVLDEIKKRICTAAPAPPAPPAAAAAGGAKRKHRRKTKKNIRRNNNGKTRFGRTF